MSVELSILLLNTLIILIAYFIIYPKMAGNNIYKITLGDLYASVSAISIVGFTYWESNLQFNLIFIKVSWFWFTLITYAIIEIPIMLWYFKKYNVEMPK